MRSGLRPSLHRLTISAMMVHAAPAWCQIIHEERKLPASDGEPYDELGISVAVDDGPVVVGALSAYYDDGRLALCHRT